MSSEPHIALVDLYAGGHHRMYLEVLSRQFVALGVPGRLTLFLGPAYERVHPGFAAELRRLAPGRVDARVLDDIPDAPEGTLTMRQLVGNDRTHGVALTEVLTHRPDHIVFMYFDHAQLTTARCPGTQVALWGIYFRPSFHYPSTSLSARIQGVRKKLVLRRALKCPALEGLFCLDPWAVEPVNKLAGRMVAHWLPDGNTTITEYTPPSSSSEPTYLFFGVLSERKGLDILMDAWQLCPPSNGRLVLAGRIPRDADPTFTARVEKFSQRDDVEWKNFYIPEDDIGALFSNADVVLIPYQWHVGSSNVLIKAAQAGRPVIGPNWGLVGRLITEHALGLAVDCSSSATLGNALQSVPADIPFDVDAARSFATANSDTNMARVLFRTLIPSWTP